MTDQPTKEYLMFQPRIHHHPRNPSEEVYGQRLEAHELIDEAVDIYEDSSGKYKKCTGLHGQQVGEHLIVIRQLPVWNPPTV